MKGKRVGWCFVLATLVWVPAVGSQQPAQTPVEGSTQTASGRRMVLLRIAQKCSKDLSSDPGCRAYAKDGEQEYAIIKDNAPTKPEAYLILPIAPVSGIEDSKVLTAPISELWDSAWLWSEKYPGRAASRTGLAINSAMGRTQDQIHIHISCVLPEVSRALAKKKVPTDPAKSLVIKLGPEHNTYRAVRVETLRGASSPFLVVGQMAGVDKNDMKDQSIFVMAAPKGRGYYVLDTTANGPGTGHAEELLDQKCEPNER